jgi:hypothetical protein
MTCIETNFYYRSTPVNDSKNTFIELDIIADQSAGVQELKDKIQFVKVYLYDENAGVLFRSYNLINPPIHNWFYNYRCYDEKVFKTIKRHELGPYAGGDSFNNGFLSDMKYIFKIPTGRNKYKFEIYDRKYRKLSGKLIPVIIIEDEFELHANQTLKINLDFTYLENRFSAKIENTNFNEMCSPLKEISSEKN